MTPESLTDALWGAFPPTSAKNSLQLHVSGLRKLMVPNGVSVDWTTAGYRLATPALYVDAMEFRRSVAEAHAATMTGSLAHASGLFSQAMNLWRGMPCQGLEHLPFHLQFSMDLVAAKASALCEWARCLMNEGHFERSIEVAEEASRFSPYDEHAWGLLALGRYRAGRQSESLATIQRAKRLLASELGLDPGPELQELEGQILSHSVPPIQEQPIAVVLDPPLSAFPVPSVTLVGRDELLLRLEPMLQNPGVITLTGLGGVGKTAIAATAATGLQVNGRPVTYLDLSTAHGMSSALAQLESIVEAPKAVRLSEEILSAVPVCVLDNADGIDGALETRLKVLTQFRHLLLLVTRRRPLGWKDERVIRIDPLPYGPMPTGPSPAATLFMEGLAPGIDPEIHAVEAICMSLEGLPLALLFAARRTRFMSLDRLASSVGASGFASVFGSKARSNTEPFGSLDAIVGATVAALESGSLSVLERCADIMGWTTYGLLDSAFGPNSSVLIDGLEELCDSGLLEAGPYDTYRLRRVAREYVLAARQENRPDPFITEIILAHVAAIVPGLFGPKAAAALQRLSLDHEPIIGALAAAIRDGQHESAVALAFSLGRYWLLAGQLKEGRQWIERVGSLSLASDSDRIRLSILGATFGSYINEVGCEVQLNELLEQASTMGVVIDRIIVNGWCALAAMEAHQNLQANADLHANKAAILAEASEDPSLIALARDLAGHVAAYRGDHDRALALALEGIDAARQSGDAYDMLNLLTAAVDNLVRLDRIPEALALSREALEHASSFESGPLVSTVLLLRADALTADGQIHEARGYLTEVLRISIDSHPDPLGTADALYILAAGAAREMRDLIAARLFEAARSFLADCGLDLESRMAGHCSREYDALSQRLGNALISTLGIGGRSDPQKVVFSVVSGSIWSVESASYPAQKYAGHPPLRAPGS
ncbi:AfsR/SARP family transcriptional regulator [Paeniglutamicibacter cryotolerans]|uniref:DNA-binding SARP family transcriptional activator/predicted ATPase n=1 Tax=Paeniglutamicibacter cryotolerans TaxID=670079 RepID=A0A839QUX2_9MICC|nr:BTAD domain-containing putative transcriptional regulator [Paeniglutamicibacter cryotolerans]MBB2997102.1 DNA-binding SARP family transcriptional activator/predicted ATPase [Paeniglutamicibacter cryotolerans]